MSFIYYWIDLIWLPLGLFVVHKHQRVLTVAFFVSCMIMMRLLVELMVSIDYERGILPLMTSDAYDRGLIVYTVFYIVFLLLAYFSPRPDKMVFMAASISIFFVASCTAILVMLL